MVISPESDGEVIANHLYHVQQVLDMCASIKKHLVEATRVLMKVESTMNLEIGHTYSRGPYFLVWGINDASHQLMGKGKVDLHLSHLHLSHLRLMTGQCFCQRYLPMQKRKLVS